LQESDDFFLAKRRFVGKKEMVLVVEEQMSENPPHIILQIGVKEVHAPSFPWRWKTSQHEQAGVGWQKRL
jgi:hypothetical protein